MPQRSQQLGIHSRPAPGRRRRESRRGISPAERQRADVPSREEAVQRAGPVRAARAPIVAPRERQAEGRRRSHAGPAPPAGDRARKDLGPRARCRLAEWAQTTSRLSQRLANLDSICSRGAADDHARERRTTQPLMLTSVLWTITCAGTHQHERSSCCSSDSFRWRPRESDSSWSETGRRS